jgi:hypothetical protein
MNVARSEAVAGVARPEDEKKQAQLYPSAQARVSGQSKYAANKNILL